MIGLRAALRRIARPAAAAAVALAAAAAGAQTPRNVIKAPHYGDSLFHFFQQRYFTSASSSWPGSRSKCCDTIRFVTAEIGRAHV